MSSSLINDIVSVLDTVPGYAGFTYGASDGNRFTLLDTPGLWGINPNDDGYIDKWPAAGKRLLAAIGDVIAGTEKVLDIAMMWETTGGFPTRPPKGLPWGAFLNALTDGFRRLNASGKTPRVRILIGIPTSVIVAAQDLEEWLKVTIPDWQHIKYRVDIATNHNSLTSWNHSKIVASDCTRAVVGGHNLWSDAYFGFGPVHDVSGLFEGPAVTVAHVFLSSVWTHPYTHVQLSSGRFSEPPPAMGHRADAFTPGPSAGSAKMLTLGRFGQLPVPGKSFNMSGNASVTARVLAFCRANSQIRLSQQTLLGPLQPGAYAYDFYTVLALIRAIRAGIRVEIVVSNEQDDYHGYADEVVKTFTAMYIFDKLGRFDKFHVPPRSDLRAWAKLTADPPWFWDRTIADRYQNWVDELNQKLFITILAFSDNGAYQWHSKGKTRNAINHAKVYIIDDTAFYVGSDNAYFATTKEGLQEFGYLVESPTDTQAFLNDYWNKLWKYSQVRRIPAKPLL